MFESNQTSYIKGCFVSKHRLVTNNFCAEQKKSMLLHAVCLQCPLQMCCCLLTFSLYRKNVMLFMLLLLLQHGGKITALVSEHFWVCYALCGLHRILAMYLRASAAQVIAVALPLALQSNILAKKNKGMYIIISFFNFISYTL